MKMRRVARIHAISVRQTVRRGSQNALLWGLFFICVASLLAATDKGWALDNNSLKGSYVMYDMQSAFGGTDANGGWGVSDSASLSRIEVTFDGAGAWSGTSTDSELERQIGETLRNVGGSQVLSNTFNVSAPATSSRAISGTYMVSQDGTGTITHSEGTEPIFVSADGSVILMGKRNYDSADHYAWVSMGIGVKKGTGLSAASLEGSYVLHDMHSAFGGTDANGGWGVSDSASLSRIEVTFDGAGAWSGTSTDNELERQIGETLKTVGGSKVLSNTFNVSAPATSSSAIGGTYTVSGDGTGTITHSEGIEPIFVSADGSVILMGKRNYDSADHYAWVSMGIGVKKGTGLSAASLRGSYLLHDMQSAFGGTDANGGWGVSDSASLSRIQVTFDGVGAWSGTSIDNELERQIGETLKTVGGSQSLSNTFNVSAPATSSRAIGGTYTVSGDGTGTITHSEGIEPIFVSADGSVILMGKRNYDSADHYAWVSMGIGVKKTLAAGGMPWMQLLLDD